MTDDSTWDASVGKNDQIIALATKVTYVQQELSNYKIKLACAKEELSCLKQSASRTAERTKIVATGPIVLIAHSLTLSNHGVLSKRELPR